MTRQSGVRKRSALIPSSHSLKFHTQRKPCDIQFVQFITYIDNIQHARQEQMYTDFQYGKHLECDVLTKEDDFRRSTLSNIAHDQIDGWGIKIAEILRFERAISRA